jgi:hypothetical protein
VLEFRFASVVANHERGQPGLLLLRQLPGGALVTQRVTAGAGPLPPQRLLGDHRDRGVVAVDLTGLEQQGNLDHDGARGGFAGAHLADPLVRACADQGPEQPLEPFPVGLLAERAAGEHRPVHRSTGRHLRTEALHDPCEDLGRQQQLVHDLIA